MPTNLFQIGGNILLHLRDDGKIVVAIISLTIDDLPALSFVDHRPCDPGD